MKVKSTFKKIILLLISASLLIGLTMVSTTKSAWAEDKEYNQKEEEIRSLEKDFFMGILRTTVNNGKPILDFAEDFEGERQALNFELAKGDAVKKYSLYDRFGSNVTFTRYLGEEVVKTTLLDKIYNFSIDKTKKYDSNFLEDIKTLVDVISSKDSIYTNTFYENRPELKTAYGDPRVSLYYQTPRVGIEEGQLGVANYFLNTAKVIYSAVIFFVDTALMDKIDSVLRGLLTNNVSKVLQGTFNVIFIMLGICLVLFIVRFAFRIKKGTGSIKEFFAQFVCACLSLGLVVAIVGNPAMFLDVSKTMLNLGDNLRNKAIGEAYKGNVLIESDIDTNKTRAAIWEDVIFKPWVHSEFMGVDYNKLYTTYAKVDKSQQWEVPDEAAKAYGDISVPISGNKEQDVKNWAALAYSCQSIYHLNAVGKTEVYTEDKDEKYNWPKADQPGGNAAIYSDDFRWIDANLKVGAYAQDESGKQLKDTWDPWNPDVYRSYTWGGQEGGNRALFKALLILPLGFLGVKKTFAMLVFLCNFMIMLYRSCLAVAFPGRKEFSFGRTLKQVFVPLLSYFFFMILILIDIHLFKAFGSSENFLANIVFVAISIYLCTLKIDTIPQTIKHGWHQAKFATRNAKNGRWDAYGEKYKQMVGSEYNSFRDFAFNYDSEADAGERIKDNTLRLQAEQTNNPTAMNRIMGNDHTLRQYAERNGIDGILTKSYYAWANYEGVDKAIDEALKKRRLRDSNASEKKVEEIRKLYRQLCRRFEGQDKDTDIINQHRHDPWHRELDYAIFWINMNDFAKGTNIGGIASDLMLNNLSGNGGRASQNLLDKTIMRNQMKKKRAENRAERLRRKLMELNSKGKLSRPQKRYKKRLERQLEKTENQANAYDQKAENYQDMQGATSDLMGGNIKMDNAKKKIIKWFVILALIVWLLGIIFAFLIAA